MLLGQMRMLSYTAKAQPSMMARSRSPREVLYDRPKNTPRALAVPQRRTLARHVRHEDQAVRARRSLLHLLTEQLEHALIE